jgi:hypothetical protein
VIAVIGRRGMSEQAYRNGNPTASGRTPEARYAYYRRCQVFRRNGEQCKAPAEKDAQICHAHAGQQATAFRRDLERRIVLAEAVAEMRRQGKPECELADLFTDFKSIQVTLAVMSGALVQGRIDCKTAGRLIVHLQTMSKLLWMVHRKGREGRKGNQELPQICAEKRRLKSKTVALSSADHPDLSEHGNLMFVEERPLRAIHDEAPRAAVDRKIREFPEESRSTQHGAWEEARAA